MVEARKLEHRFRQILVNKYSIIMLLPCSNGETPASETWTSKVPSILASIHKWTLYLAARELSSTK